MKLPLDSRKSKTGLGISWRTMKFYYIGIGVLLVAVVLYALLTKP